MRRLLGLTVFFILMSAAGTGLAAPSASSPSSSQDPQQMQDFNIAGYGPQGEKTWEMQGANMDMEGNDVKISDITAHLYGENENMKLTADRGTMNKETGVMHLESNVRAVTDGGATLDTNYLDWSQKDQVISTKDKVNITRDNMTAVGQGIEARPNLKVATLEKDVIMTIDDKKKAEAGKDKKASSGSVPEFGKGQLVITCDGPMELAYEKQYAIFNDNVKVDDVSGAGTLYADKMTIYFSQASKQIDKMEAKGHVRIVRGENTSYSDGAIFTMADKKVTLTGRPKLVVFSEEGMNVSP